MKTSGVLHGISSPQMGMSEGVMASRLAQAVAKGHAGGDLCDDGKGTSTISNGTRAGINPRATPLKSPQASGAAQGGVGLHVGVGLSDDGPCELLTSELMQALIDLPPSFCCPASKKQQDSGFGHGNYHP